MIIVSLFIVDYCVVGCEFVGVMWCNWFDGEGVCVVGLFFVVGWCCKNHGY